MKRERVGIKESFSKAKGINDILKYGIDWKALDLGISKVLKKPNNITNLSRW